MNCFNRVAGASASARKSVALMLIAVMLTASLVLADSSRPSGHVEEMQLCSDLVVTVTPLSAWQSQYPGCTVSAQADECGAPPIVSFSGGTCYPGSGTMNIARVDVVDESLECAHSYLVKSINGGIYIVIIDPK